MQQRSNLDRKDRAFMSVGGSAVVGGEAAKMSGIFSRISGSGRRGHRRAQSAIDIREPLPQNSDIEASIITSAAHGIETAFEFKPVEHPTEPFDNDQPVKCPLPEPSILNDGRIWKERSERMTSASARMRSDLPVVEEGSQLGPEVAEPKPQPQPVRRKRVLLPSLSAPENNLIAMLEECDLG